MKKVSVFRASDGRDFDDKAKCLRREAHVKSVKKLLAWTTPGKPSDCSFANGDGYYELAPGVVEQYDREAEKVIRKFDGKDTGDRYAQCPTGFVGRILGDSDSPSYALWAQRCCMAGGKLYGQPYYANNPHECCAKVFGRVELLKEGASQ